MLTPGQDPHEFPAPGDAAPASPEGSALPGPPGPPPLSRARAIGEAVLCSSYPTQIVAAALLWALGVAGGDGDGGLNATFIIAISLLDAAFVVALIVFLLRRRGESLREVMLGTAPRWREAALGVAIVLPVTIGVALLR